MLLDKEIVNSDMSSCEWRSCLMFFSEKWVTKLHSDPAWLNLKLYLHELAWRQSEYRRNNFYYDIAFSIIQKKRNLKPNPYLADTARHLFTIALGDAPGYAPACNNDALPLDLLQKVFVECYGLKKHLPTIFKPTHFNFEEDKFPVYYSLQHPTTQLFSPPSRETSSTLYEMRELEHIVRIFSDELKKENTICSDTIMSKIAKNTAFNFFHNKKDRHRIISLTENIAQKDQRLSPENHKHKAKDAEFSSDARFVRGCISISSK